MRGVLTIMLYEAPTTGCHVITKSATHVVPRLEVIIPAQTDLFVAPN